MPKSVYRDRLTARWDKGLFLIAWVGGTAGILLLKTFTQSASAVVAWPTVVLLAYAAVIWRSPKFRVREDRAGDSCYYLGFLFTLSSLAYALWEFGRGGSTLSDSVRQDKVIENFAVALASTIVGLVLRVVFQQFREDPFEVEQEVRLELSEAANRVKGEMLHAVEEFSTLRTAIGQELRNEFTRAVTQIAKDCSEAIRTTTLEHSKAVKSALDSVSESAESMKNQVKSIRTSSTRVADAFDVLGNKLSTAQVPIAQLQDSLSKLSAAAGDTRVAMQQIGDQTRNVGQAVQSIAAITNSIGVALDQWKQNLATGTENWKHATRTEIEAIKEQLQIVEESSRNLNQLRIALNRAVSESQKAVVTTQRSLASLADVLVERM